ncbi:SDR family oxidoreductase [Ignisphaera sp. 4213-co]|uniref:SDR family oxidoreductase n=1 Tax=Ignisphaera cupida TaxID=3050454 RepID=A0ABD4Z8H4_9CREN|nr:SDR family oxidoreductase [Ignisphaera sp. 4213-co]MDK6028863.1 SDR family oxidoreductase [Ignisphaera sp. 4213-co]
MRRFENRVCVVTGGARGIGAAIAYRLGLEGCKVAILDIDDSAGSIRIEELRARGIEATYIHADVASENDVSKAMDTVFSRYNAINVLVNNAGIGSSGKSIEEQTIDEWRRVIDVNLTGAWLCTKHAVRYMKKSGGVIINIASTRAFQSEPNTEPYSASKGGLVALTHALAISLAKYGIRVLSISPGWVDTSNWQIPPRESVLTPLDNLWHPAGRVGKPEDIAALVAFLASDEASWITGVNIIIDGGVTAKMVYMDENVIEWALSILFQDTTIAKLFRDAIEKVKRYSDRERVKRVLEEMLNKL